MKSPIKNETAWVAIRKCEGREYLDMNSMDTLRDRAIDKATAYDKLLPDYAKVHPIQKYRQVIIILEEPGGSP